MRSRFESFSSNRSSREAAASPASFAPDLKPHVRSSPCWGITGAIPSNSISPFPPPPPPLPPPSRPRSSPCSSSHSHSRGITPSQSPLLPSPLRHFPRFSLRLQLLTLFLPSRSFLLLVLLLHHRHPSSRFTASATGDTNLSNGTSTSPTACGRCPVTPPSSITTAQQQPEAPRYWAPAHTRYSLP
jgi:hypothetical protein